MVGLHQHPKLAAKKDCEKKFDNWKKTSSIVRDTIWYIVQYIVLYPASSSKVVPDRLPQLGRNWAPQTPEILWHQGLRCILSQAVDTVHVYIVSFWNWVYPHKVGYWDRKKWWLGNKFRATLFSDKATYPWLVQWWFNHQKLSMGAKWDIPSGKLTVCYWKLP